MRAFSKNMWNNIQYVLATHCGYTSQRKVDAFSEEKIKEVLKQECCSNKCLESLDEGTIIKWRKKYHLMVMGFEQRKKLLELYEQTLFHKKKGETVHLLDQKLICK